MDGLDTVLRPALQEHAAAIDLSAHTAAARFETQWEHCQETISQHCDTLSSQQQSLVTQYEALIETHSHTESIVAIQRTLDANLQRLTETNAAIDRSVSAAAGDGMANAMRILARAVDVLTAHLPEPSVRKGKDSSRRAA